MDAKIISPAHKIISSISQSYWPEKKQVHTISNFDLELWTETIGNEKYLWAVLINKSDTHDYKIMKREKVIIDTEERH